MSSGGYFLFHLHSVLPSPCLIFAVCHSPQQPNSSCTTTPPTGFFSFLRIGNHYPYMSINHHAMSIATMLGHAASHRGQGNQAVAHQLLPVPFAELPDWYREGPNHHPQPCIWGKQAAALLSVGLLLEVGGPGGPQLA